jgi:hypothetical protein
MLVGGLAGRASGCSKRDGCRTLLGARQHIAAPTRRGVLARWEVQLPASLSYRPDRRMKALSKANEVRVARARLKQQLRDRDARIEQILAAPPACVATAMLLDLLLAVPKIGPVRAGRLLTTARVRDTKVIGTLSERQRGHLIDLLRDRADADPED